MWRAIDRFRGVGGFVANGHAGEACTHIMVVPAVTDSLRIGNEFLPSDLIAEISAEECRDHKMIVLTPTLALRPILLH
ncbi:hypothetical protein [Bradyrhizobium sp. BR 1432]|uniref:hypothetical protein n=1 Tax=Bradyrhizobium sp. BR 1432 TaxID=3447966 RepID=UPI003EE6D02D